MITPEELTGALVRQMRDQAKLSRKEFTALTNFKAQSRIGNIELHDSWKPGDREEVARVLNSLLASGGVKPTPPSPSAPASSPARTDNGDSPTHDVVIYDDEDADYDLIVVGTADDAPQVAQPPVTSLTGEDIRPPVPHVGDVLDVPPGTTILSNGQMALWNECRRRWWLAIYRQLRPNVEDGTGALATGDRVHRALAPWYVPDGQPRVDPRDALERAIVEDWTVISRRAAELGYDDLRLADLAHRFQVANSLERAMIEGYVEWLAESGADADYRITGAEQAMAVDFTVSDDDSDGRGTDHLVRLVGRLDTRMTRVSDGVRLFLETKTAPTLQKPTAHIQPQPLTYQLIEWLNTPEGEARCDGALYNILRKVKRTERATPPFYGRIEVRHNEIELRAYKRRVEGIARDIIRTTQLLDAGADPLEVVYPAPTDDCSWKCEFFAVCGMFDDGSRVEDAISTLFRREDPTLRYAGLERVTS